MVSQKDIIAERIKLRQSSTVGFSLKLPSDLKIQLDFFCSDHGVSVNSFIVECINSILNPDLRTSHYPNESEQLEEDLIIISYLLDDKNTGTKGTNNAN